MLTSAVHCDYTFIYFLFLLKRLFLESIHGTAQFLIHKYNKKKNN